MMIVDSRSYRWILTPIKHLCVFAAVEKAPYSVTESGWGEFEIQIKIHWVDPREKPVSFYHLLKLYPNDTTLAKENSIISEFYDEIVFPNASSAMYQAIEAFNTSGSG